MSQYDDYLADLELRRSNQVRLSEVDYYALYGLAPVANPIAFQQGAINSGQYGDVGSISISQSGDVVVQRNAEPMVPVTYDPTGAMMASFSPNVYYTANPANISDLILPRSGGPLPGTPVGSGFNSLPFQIQSPSQAADIGRTLGYAGCGQIADLTLRSLCIAAVGVAGNLLNGNGMPDGSGTMQNGGGMFAPSDCPSGYTRVGNGCVKLGAMLPGGQPGIVGSTGIYGVPSVSPTMRSSMKLVCPRGLVLGLDNRCYAKGSIGRQARKWKPEPKPLVSRSDVKALNRISSIKKRVKKAASSAGLHYSSSRTTTRTTKRK
jgi:hypothetical protein